MYVHHILLIYKSVDEHLGCFCLLAIVNNAAMNLDEKVSVWIFAFTSFVYTQVCVKEVLL